MRPSPYGGDNKDSAAEEFYVLDAHGDLQAKLWAAEALVDRALRRPRNLPRGLAGGADTTCGVGRATGRTI